jgi:hypothetical protein
MYYDSYLCALRKFSLQFMPHNSIIFKNSLTSKLIFLFSIFVYTFICLGQVIDVYRNAIAGAIFEYLWLPSLGLAIFLPIVSFIFWRKEKFNVRSLYLYTLLLFIAAILFIFFSNKP